MFVRSIGFCNSNLVVASIVVTSIGIIILLLSSSHKRFIITLSRVERDYNQEDNGESKQYQHFGNK